MSYEIVSTYINIAAVLRNEKKPDSAMIYYYKADLIDVKKHLVGVKIILYEEMSNTYKELKDYESAFKYLEKQKVFENINDNNEIIKAIRDIDTKYQTKENKLQISSLKDTLEKAGIVLIVLLLALIVFFLGYQNLRRKKKIAEQEQLIQNQKLENILQEQELNEIDKLIEGQEKERIKIANELHDNMGSMLATIKLNFENLKQQKKSNGDNDQYLFDKTDDLLEEAYQKIRTIAHTKNAGVIGNQGLVPALYNIANKITIPGKLLVQVIPFGLNERLENSLELTIFRMVQELLTNAVKHAQATIITISLTQHENNLNIIIEDNGKGFDPKTINKNEGMGLHHIEKKTEQLGGNFSIDSTEGRGTSILIDLPL
jgi:signal transduction histidine kinase